MDWGEATYRQLQKRCKELDLRPCNKAALQLREDIIAAEGKEPKLSAAEDEIRDGLAYTARLRGRYEPSADIEIIDTDNFTQIKKLGSGVGGAVFLVQRSDTRQERYALKRGEYEGKSYLLRPFLREIAHMVRLSHPNVIRAVGAFVGTESSYILMPLYSESLASLWLIEAELVQRLARPFAYDIITAVSYLHSRNVLHRDIKPQNIFYDKLNNRLVIGDLGSSTSLFCGRKDLGHVYEVVTLWYRAPELLNRAGREKQEEHSYPVDVWSVGVVIYEMLVSSFFAPASDEKDASERITKNLIRINKKEVRDIEEKEIQDTLLLELVRKMLRLLPSERITAHEAMGESVFDVIKDKTRESESPSCLETLQTRGLQVSDDPFQAARDQGRSPDGLFDWLVSLTFLTALDGATLFLARHIIDEALPTLGDDLRTERLATLYVASLMTAAIYRGNHVPDYKHLENLVEGLKDLEVSVAKVINAVKGDLSLATAYDFIDGYCGVHYAGLAERDVGKYAKAIAVLYIFSSTYYSYSASDIALSAIYYATVYAGLEYKQKDLLYPPDDKRPRPSVEDMQKDGPREWIDKELGVGAHEKLKALMA